MCRIRVGLLTFLTCSAFGQDSHPDFTGGWKYQEYEMDRIDQHEPVVRISSSIRRADVVFTYTFRTDGRVLRTTGKGADEVDRSAYWEGNYLVLETKRINNSGPTTERVTLSLSSDGREMTKHTQLFGPDNQKRADDIMVFHKTGDDVRDDRR